MSGATDWLDRIAFGLGSLVLGTVVCIVITFAHLVAPWFDHDGGAK